MRFLKVYEFFDTLLSSLRDLRECRDCFNVYGGVSYSQSPANEVDRCILIMVVLSILDALLLLSSSSSVLLLRGDKILLSDTLVLLGPLKMDTWTCLGDPSIYDKLLWLFLMLFFLMSELPSLLLFVIEATCSLFLCYVCFRIIFGSDVISSSSYSENMGPLPLSYNWSM